MVVLNPLNAAAVAVILVSAGQSLSPYIYTSYITAWWVRLLCVVGTMSLCGRYDWPLERSANEDLDLTVIFQLQMMPIQQTNTQTQSHTARPAFSRAFLTNGVGSSAYSSLIFHG